jgi:hypothetical protein
MKSNAGAIVGMLVLDGPLPLFAALAMEPYDAAIVQFNTATSMEKAK